MKNNRLILNSWRVSFFTLGIGFVTGYANLATALPFTYTNNDLLLGFRKTGVNQENYEVVVNIGPAVNYLNAAVNSTVSVPNFSLSQLVPDSFTSLNNLNWSVSGFTRTNLTNVLPGGVNNTLWVTVPRTAQNVQSSPPNRLTYSAQGQVATAISSIGANAAYLSSLTLSNNDNTAKLVREPINNPSDLSAFIGGVSDSTASSFGDSWPHNAEITTPASFSGGLISDFYEVRPTNDSRGNPVVDPHTQLSTGAAYYVGYFEFKPDGTMTFTRASTNSGPSSPPPVPQILSATRSGSTTTLLFTTTNGATYTLYFTNSTGLNAPIS
ncbi:MAG TPA: hypothetical protein VHI52_11705, partial [Verrucomicrobiae bacterium]|nr:hypothetical protein [Verrucomicrobiae bacterium]